MEWDVIRVWSRTYKQIRMMAAVRGLTLGKTVAILVDAEFKRMGLVIPLVDKVPEGEELEREVSF